MAIWKAFLPLILPEAPGCPKALAVNKVRSAAIDFCKETNIWHEYIDPLFWPAGVKTADIDPPQHTRIAQILSIEVGGAPLVTGQFSATNDIVTLTVTPLYDTIGALNVALKPSLTSTEIADSMFEDWGEIIAQGALAKLMAMKGKKWSNIPGAELNYKLYRSGIVDAKTHVAKSGTSQSLQVELRRV
ncbi:hypothetical protein SYK_02890 [Pseudodesulfovibrio nedwellii]|uniref:Uncharacterized protein n=1 Tax=Pseudodesulfovibrio nedwellii TaxID=2973072 RepID=A0ABN6RY36_9BACT|nr:hypothetical protein [Pseudodesulfovibrio nedwellii]BDQ35929.1 hypothetical protein SYK_02890 [Pseudodesulfovibrio nedwellii]